LVANYHGGSILTALMDLFPDIGLDKSRFGKAVWSKWADAKQRRAFFVRYAKENGFDPLNPEDWYSQSLSNIIKKGSQVIRYHGVSVMRALIDLFPDIGLDSSKFGKNWRKWTDSKQREFFVTYATKRGFDPLDPKNWYSQNLQKIKILKGANQLIRYHGDSIIRALLHAFPNIGLDRSILAKRKRGVQS